MIETLSGTSAGRPTERKTMNAPSGSTVASTEIAIGGSIGIVPSPCQRPISGSNCFIGTLLVVVGHASHFERVVEISRPTYTRESRGHRDAPAREARRAGRSACPILARRPRLVRELLRCPDTGAVRGLGGDQQRPAHADPR